MIVERAETVENRAASWEFDINRKCVKKWWKDKEKLISMPKSNHANPFENAQFLGLVKNLKSCSVSHQNFSVSIFTTKILIKAWSIAFTNPIKKFQGKLILTLQGMNFLLEQKQLLVKNYTMTGK